MDRPNILLIVSDDHGRESLGCYGNTVIDTANMDALAADGVRFTNGFCTTASCAASRSVILTGVYNHKNGTYGHTHAYHHFSCFDGIQTLPALMNAAGYRTACVGKKHYAPESLYPFQTDMGDGHGRDDVRMAESCRGFIEAQADEPFFLYWCSHNPHRSGEVVETHPERPNRFGNPERAFDGDREATYADEDVEVPRFLTDNEATRAELAQYYQSISRLDRGIGRLIDIVKGAGAYDNTLVIYISDNGAAFPGSKTTLYEPGMNLPCIVKAPAGEAATAAGGSSSGAVTDALVTWADITPTILDFAGVYAGPGGNPNHGADSGPARGSSGGPEPDKDRRSGFGPNPDQDGRSVSVPDRFHGRSFRSILGTESPDDWREEVFASHTFHEVTNYYPMRVVRTKRHKFVWNIAHPLTYTFASDLWASPTWRSVAAEPGGVLGRRKVSDYLHHDRFELYDLDSDPDEIDNLAGRPEYEELVASFCRKLRTFQERTGDPWVHKWEYE